MTVEGVRTLANASYKAGSYTPLDKLMNPFWLWAAGLLPKWVEFILFSFFP